MGVAHSLESLAFDLQRLGVTTGDILFVHSSFRSLGPVEGGAETVVRAFERTLGPAGLLLMPSFNLVERSRRAETWDLHSTPSTVGWLTEYFRSMPGTFRSDHYSHSVAARGAAAENWVAGHSEQSGWISPWDQLPWGRTYGDCSPMVRAFRENGKLLMLGVDYTSSTYVHVVETLLRNRALEHDASAPHPALDRVALGQFWDELGSLSRGKVGNAECRLFAIRAYVGALAEEVIRQPDRYLR
jgi:aminoglycoside 3-N-acetyltransferase